MIEPKAVEWLKKHHRLTNYLSAAMLYLKENMFLEEPLVAENIKERILGHWGTVPGLNVLYGATNYLVKTENQKSLFIAGPGHGAPAVLSNLFIEGTLGEYYPEVPLSKEGIQNLIKLFSWPSGFPSHTYPGIPGTILEGGELGYSLGTAFGAAFDNPDLMVVCVVGDGESETGPLAASWHSNKFINPVRDGFVLPVVHLNGYRISGPTVLGTMSVEEVEDYYSGLGYDPLIVNQYESEDIYRDILETFFIAYEKMTAIRNTWGKSSAKLRWPVIVFKSMKGWTCPTECEGRPIEDHNNSHGIPFEHPKTNEVELKTIESWLRSYDFNSLLNEDKTIKKDIYEFIPEGEMRMGVTPEAIGGNMRIDLTLPELYDFDITFNDRGEKPESSMKHMGQYFEQVFRLNDDKNNFRLFSPDESESNKLGEIFDITQRMYTWPSRERDAHISDTGRVMEILSEHVLQEWLQGYVLTGRHGVLISYEAFLGIITTMVDQYIKYLKQSKKIDWRTPLPSMNLVATSTGWRQDHNGFSHQNPSMINTLLCKQSDYVSIYFPADVNILLATLNDCFSRTDCLNLIVSGKRELPQWLNMDEAIEHVKNGIGIWDWAGNVEDKEMPDVVLVSAGDYQTQETIAAGQILKEIAPELKFQYVNVNELTRLGIGDEHNPLMTQSDYSKYFTEDRDVIFNFHGYPDAIKQLTWGRKISNQLILLGYIEEGTTTTPFDMQVLNKASRYHVCIQAVLSAARFNESIKQREESLVRMFSEILSKHQDYIVANGDDIPEVKEFKFDFE
jgi:xylulose-5-phosphate/fructose-6-phosphate phosphoketolase